MFLSIGDLVFSLLVSSFLIFEKILSMVYVYSNLASVSFIDSIFPISCFFLLAAIDEGFFYLAKPLLNEFLLA